MEEEARDPEDGTKTLGIPVIGVLKGEKGKGRAYQSGQARTRLKCNSKQSITSVV